MLIREGQNTREAALRRYFAKPPEKPSTTGLIVMITIGGLLLLVGGLNLNGDDDFGFAFALICTGAILAGVGWAQLSTVRHNYEVELEKLRPQPSDQQVHTWLAESYQKLVDHSCQALGLNKAEAGLSEPLPIQTPVVLPVEGVDSEDIVWKRGEDRGLLFGVYRMTVLWITERHLASYSCYYDFIRDVPAHEWTDEFHFCDVLSFSTRETSETDKGSSKKLETGLKRTVRQEFVVSVGNGDSLRITMNDDKVREITGEETYPESGAEEAVRAIRAMLRNAKQKESEPRLSSAA